MARLPAASVAPPPPEERENPISDFARGLRPTARSALIYLSWWSINAVPPLCHGVVCTGPLLLQLPPSAALLVVPRDDCTTKGGDKGSHGSVLVRCRRHPPGAPRLWTASHWTRQHSTALDMALCGHGSDGTALDGPVPLCLIPGKSGCHCGGGGSIELDPQDWGQAREKGSIMNQLL